MSQSQIVADFVVRARTYVLLNSSDEDIEFMAGGQTIKVPAATRALPPHPKYDDVPHSLILEGQLVPGTLVLRDIMGTDEIGETSSDPVWSAASAVKLVLGISTVTGQASSGYAQRGLSLLPSSTDREEIERLRQEGRARWQTWRLAQAQQVVRAHDERNEIRRKANVPLAPGDRDYIQSMHLLNVAGEADRQQARESLQLQDANEPTADDLAELIKEKLSGLQVGPSPLSSAALVEQLLSDPKALALLKETHKVRKLRGPNKAKEPEDQ